MATAGKPITCRAAVVWKVKESFSIETVEVAVPQKGEVRIKMISAGVCHSDLHLINGIMPDWHFPALLGHEGAGTIESVGEGVTAFKPGDLVVVVFEGYCGECTFCKDSRTNMCQKQPRNNFQKDGTSRITCKCQKLSQMCSIGTFTEYTVTSEDNVTKVNPKANPKSLALAGCCIPVGYGAVMNVAKVPKGATCAVWGLGGVGMCVVMACRDSGASKIIGVDTNPKKFTLGKELGCTDFINPKEVDDVPKKLAEMTNGGVDFCFEVVGGGTATMEQAFKSSHPYWGKTVIIGEATFRSTMNAGVWDLIYGRQLAGTFLGSYKAKLAIPTLVDKVVEGEIQMDKLVTHRIPLDKINEGYKMLLNGESLRSIIDFSLST